MEVGLEGEGEVEEEEIGGTIMGGEEEGVVSHPIPIPLQMGRVMVVEVIEVEVEEVMVVVVVVEEVGGEMVEEAGGEMVEEVGGEMVEEVGGEMVEEVGGEMVEIKRRSHGPRHSISTDKQTKLFVRRPSSSSLPLCLFSISSLSTREEGDRKETERKEKRCSTPVQRNREAHYYRIRLSVALLINND